MRLFLVLALLPSLAQASDYLGAANLSYPNSPKVAKPGKACPAPLNENFCAADVVERDGFDAEVHAALKAIKAATIWSSTADAWLAGEVIPRLDLLGNPTANKSFNMVDNHLSFNWVQPVAGGGIDGAVEFQASGAFSGDLVHIHQYNGNPGAGTHLLHVEGSDPDVVPVHIVSGNALALHTDEGIQAGSFIGASGNIEARIAALEAAVASLGGGSSPVQAPTCTAISPTSGPVGTVVTFTGTAFATATAVTFPTARSASFSKQSDAQITATVPASTVDGAPTVTTTGGTATCPAFDVTTGAPSAPQSLAVGSVTASTIALSWAAPATGTPTGYHVHIAPDVAGVPGTYTNAATLGLVTSYTVSGLSLSTKYWLYVHATSAAGDGLNAAPVSATTSGGDVVATGEQLFGTTHSPSNLPISFWEAGILAHFSVASVVDSLATTDLQNCLTNVDGYGCSNWGATPPADPNAYVAFGQDSYTVYYSAAGDLEVPGYRQAGTARPTCPLDIGKAWAGTFRLPAATKVWNSTTHVAQSINPYVTADTDIHLHLIDVERNRIYAFYCTAGDKCGVDGGHFYSTTASCDLLRGNDTTIQNVIATSIRYACPTGAAPSYGDSTSAGPDCGTAGIGAGVSAGSFGNGDGNGYDGPYGAIMPQDFDDSGWTGEAVGTFHHALRFQTPVNAQYGYVWPHPDPGSGLNTRYLLNGQIMRLDPAFDIVAATGGATPTDFQLAQRRLLKTLQVYGAVVADYGGYGPEFFALSQWAGTGLNPSAYGPWTAAGGANAEAQAFASGVNVQGVKFGVMPASAYGSLEMVLPHAAAHPARVIP